MDLFTAWLLIVIVSPLIYLLGYGAALNAVKRGSHKADGYRYDYLQSRAHVERVARQGRACHD